MTRLTDAVFKEESRKQTKFETVDDFNCFLQAAKRNLEIFTKFFAQWNKTLDETFDELVPIENDLTLFTYEQFDVHQYKPNAIGECVITNIVSCVEGQCYINDLRK